MRRLLGIQVGLGAAVILVVVACGGSTPAATSPAVPPATDAPAATAASPSPEAPADTPASTSDGAACESTTEPGSVAVTIEGFAYAPDPVEAAVGDVITWTNRDGAAHSATVQDMDCTTANLGQDQSGSLVFSEAGTYRYICRVHGTSMSGTIEIQ